MNLFELFVKIGVDDKASPAMKNTQKNSETLANKMKSMSAQFESAQKNIDDLTKQYNKSAQKTGETSQKTQELSQKLNSAKESLETTKNKLAVLASQYDTAKKNVADLTKEFNKSAKETGASSKETQELAKKLDDAEKEAEQAKKALDGYNSEVEETAEKTEKASGGLSNFASKLGKGLATAAKIGAAAVGAAATGITALTTAAVNNYAEYEQLVGGVQTLFSKSKSASEDFADSIRNDAEAVKEFQKAHGLVVDGILGPQTMAEIEKQYGQLEDVVTSSADVVIKNASEAFRTAGLSANQYMETVTSFSASLIQSLGGDTIKAAEYADMAIIDMADNANKMGTSMEMIQNAYQGFAKQNYTIKFIYSPAA